MDGRSGFRGDEFKDFVYRYQPLRIYGPEGVRHWTTFTPSASTTRSALHFVYDVRMSPPQRSDAELNADLVDVHVLDMTAQIEALLRGVRDVQRGILRVRGRVQNGAPTDRRVAAADVQRRLSDMLTDCDALKEAINEGLDRADGLRALADEE
jgi:hypothetical protein